jgi:hypothetical protein
MAGSGRPAPNGLSKAPPTKKLTKKTDKKKYIVERASKPGAVSVVPLA